LVENLRTKIVRIFDREKKTFHGRISRVATSRTPGERCISSENITSRRRNVTLFGRPLHIL
jgi:hypothetical protein